MIWRRLLVRSDLTLFGLHRVIQIAFGWEDYHLHAFKVHGRPSARSGRVSVITFSRMGKF